MVVLQRDDVDRLLEFLRRLERGAGRKTLAGKVFVESAELVGVAVVRKLEVAMTAFQKEIGGAELRVVVLPELERELRAQQPDRAEDRGSAADLVAVKAGERGRSLRAAVDLGGTAGDVFRGERDDVQHAPVRVFTVQRRTGSFH